MIPYGRQDISPADIDAVVAVLRSDFLTQGPVVPRFEQAVRAFFADMFRFSQFDGLSKDRQIYPKFTGQVAKDAGEQTLRTVVDLVLRARGDYRDLFTTRKTWLTPTLGALYGAPAPS